MHGGVANESVRSLVRGHMIRVWYKTFTIPLCYNIIPYAFEYVVPIFNLLYPSTMLLSAIRISKTFFEYVSKRLASTPFIMIH